MINPSASDLHVFRFAFYPDKPAVLADAGDASSAAAHEGIDCGSPDRSHEADQPAHERHGFDRRVMVGALLGATIARVVAAGRAGLARLVLLFSCELLEPRVTLGARCFRRKKESRRAAAVASEGRSVIPIRAEVGINPVRLFTASFWDRSLGASLGWEMCNNLVAAVVAKVRRPAAEARRAVDAFESPAHLGGVQAFEIAFHSFLQCIISSQRDAAADDIQASSAVCGEVAGHGPDDWLASQADGLPRGLQRGTKSPWNNRFATPSA